MFRDSKSRPKSLEFVGEGRRGSAPADSRIGSSKWQKRLTRFGDGPASPELGDTSGSSPKIHRRSSTSESAGFETRSPAHAATNSTQGSRTSGGARKTKPSSEAVLKDDYQHPVSRQPLPAYRKAKTALFWPRRPHGKERYVVERGTTVRNPHRAFLEKALTVGGSPKSKVIAGRFETEEGTDDHVAVKIVFCDENTIALAKGKKSNSRNEFDNLLAVDHPHIIAMVGSYEDTEHQEFGILLYPLALSNLEQELHRLPGYSSSQKDKCEYQRRIGFLLSYLPCLCKALLYLHENAIRHQDVKPSNILLDCDHNVILADFDIAKKHTSRTQDITDSKVQQLTVKYAPKHVKDQKERGRDWDIYALGCVFLEIATVVMGETITNLHRHLVCGPDKSEDGWQEIELHYNEAIDKGHVDSWIVHLKESCRSLPPEDIPASSFNSNKAKQRLGGFEKCLDQFFSQIRKMLNAKPGAEGILEEAVTYFELLTENNCEHCFSKSPEGPPDGLQPAIRISSPKSAARPPFETILEASPNPTATPKFHRPVGGVDDPKAMGASNGTGPTVLQEQPKMAESINGHANQANNVDRSQPKRPNIIVTSSTQHEQDELSARNMDSLQNNVNGTVVYGDKSLNSEPAEYVEPLPQPELPSSWRHPVAESDDSRLPASVQDNVTIKQQPEPIEDVDVTDLPLEFHTHLSVERGNLEVSSTHSPANRQEFFRSYGRTAEYNGDSKRIRGRWVLEYNINTKSIKPVRSDEMKDDSGLFYDLPRLANHSLRLPTRDTDGNTVGGILRPKKALSFKLNLMRAMGLARQLFVPGLYSKEEVDKCKHS